MAKKSYVMEGPYYIHGIGESVESFEKKRGGKAIFYSGGEDMLSPGNRLFYIKKKKV